MRPTPLGVGVEARSARVAPPAKSASETTPPITRPARERGGAAGADIGRGADSIASGVTSVAPASAVRASRSPGEDTALAPFASTTSPTRSTRAGPDTTVAFSLGAGAFGSGISTGVGIATGMAGELGAFAITFAIAATRCRSSALANGASASASSATVAQRSVRSRRRHFITTASSSSEISGRRWRSGMGSLKRMSPKSSPTVDPSSSKGSL